MATKSDIQVEAIAHSKLGASGAHRWVNCAGSRRLVDSIRGQLTPSELISFEKSGIAAAEGTAAHELGAKCLQEEVDAWTFAGQTVEVDGFTFTVDEEMVLGVQVYVDHVRSLFEQYAEQGAVLYVENSMQSVLDDEAFGTSDAMIFVPGEKLIVVDLKFGKGIVVEPDSVQNKYYGYLGLESFATEGVKEVETWIVQPRIPHPKGPCRSDIFAAEDIKKWFTEEVLPAMAATREKDSPLNVGDWCRYCAARDSCPAIKGETMNFDTTLDPEYMTDEEIGTVLQKVKAIAAWMSGLEEEAFNRARSGAEVPGFKLVKKKANRTLKEGAEKAAVKKWGDDAYHEPKLKTAPQLEKLEGGNKFVSRWAYTPDTGLTLAPESDTRKAVKLTGDEIFGDMTE